MNVCSTFLQSSRKLLPTWEHLDKRLNPFQGNHSLIKRNTFLQQSDSISWKLQWVKKCQPTNITFYTISFLKHCKKKIVDMSSTLLEIKTILRREWGGSCSKTKEKELSVWVYPGCKGVGMSVFSKERGWGFLPREERQRDGEGTW